MNLLSAFLWAIAVAAFSSSFTGWWGILFAATGAFAGALLPTLFLKLNGPAPSRHCTFRSQRALVAFILITPVLGVVAGCISTFGPFLPMGLHGSLVLPDGLSLAVLGGMTSNLVSGLALRFPAIGIVEGGLLVVLSARMLCLHRYSHLTQPFWMVDYFAGHGIDFNQYVGFGVFGLAVSLLLLISIMAKMRARSSVRKRSNRVSAVIVLVVLGVFGTIVGITLPMPSISARVGTPQSSSGQGTSRKEQKQDDQSSTDEPPLPPPPLPAVTGCVASIRFDSDYRPPVRLGALYFRYQVFSRYSRCSLVEDRTNAVVSAGWTPNALDVLDHTEPTLIRAPPKTTVRTTVRLLQNLAVPIALVSSWKGSKTPPPDRRFVAAWKMESVCPGWSAPDLDSFDNAVLIDPLWGAEEIRSYGTCPDDPTYGALVGTIFSNVAEEVSEASKQKRVCVIRDWIASNCTYSAVGKNSDLTLPDFLFKDKRGGPRQFALATALLCRAAGVASRVANGFCCRISRNDVGITREFQIGDQQAFAWAEVYLPGCGWIPVDSAPPPSAMGDEIAPPPLQIRNPIRRQHVLWVLVLGLSGYWCVIAWRRWLRPHICFKAHRHVYVYVAALDLVALAGFRRRYGETRGEFAVRVANECSEAGYPQHLGSCFATLTRMHLDVCCHGGTIYGRRDWLKELRLLASTVTLCVRCQQALPLCWLNADNPTQDNR